MSALYEWLLDIPFPITSQLKPQQRSTLFSAVGVATRLFLNYFDELSLQAVYYNWGRVMYRNTRYFECLKRY